MICSSWCVIWTDWSPVYKSMINMWICFSSVWWPHRGCCFTVCRHLPLLGTHFLQLLGLGTQLSKADGTTCLWNLSVIFGAACVWWSILMIYFNMFSIPIKMPLFLKRLQRLCWYWDRCGCFTGCKNKFILALDHKMVRKKIAFCSKKVFNLNSHWEKHRGWATLN